MKIYTKTGDNGSTSLVGGTRVSKASLRIDTYGTVDELNSWIGLLRDQEVNLGRKDFLKEIQDRLFTVGAELASEPDQTKKKIPDLYESDVEVLETSHGYHESRHSAFAGICTSRWASGSFFYAYYSHGLPPSRAFDDCLIRK